MSADPILFGDIEAALAASEREESPAQRFVQAHLAALRIAALALAGRPRRRGALRHPSGAARSVWEVLPEVRPELGEWAAFYGALQLKRQAVQAGAWSIVSEREADDLVRETRMFHDLVLGGRGVEPAGSAARQQAGVR